MGWSRAYHYHLNRPISIIEAMKLRDGKDPRAGDLHCHKECFESKTGSRILTRRESSDGRRAHFARWPGSYTKAKTSCGYQSIADSKRESMDYAHYYSNFERFLNETQRASEPYFIDEVDTEIGQLMPDFVIRHSSNTPYEIVKTQIHIVDENNRRRKKFDKSKVDGKEAVIVIRISEFTLEQLNDFQRGGIERLELEWRHVLELISEEQRREAEESEDISDIRSANKEKLLKEVEEKYKGFWKEESKRETRFEKMLETFEGGFSSSEEILEAMETVCRWVLGRRVTRHSYDELAINLTMDKDLFSEPNYYYTNVPLGPSDWGVVTMGLGSYFDPDFQDEMEEKGYRFSWDSKLVSLGNPPTYHRAKEKLSELIEMEEVAWANENEPKMKLANMIIQKAEEILADVESMSLDSFCSKYRLKMPIKFDSGSPSKEQKSMLKDLENEEMRSKRRRLQSLVERNPITIARREYYYDSDNFCAETFLDNRQYNIQPFNLDIESKTIEQYPTLISIWRNTPL